ncbi:hypothetical protein PT282_06245 [Bifidobacterium sp. ESL0763]|uniref:hypothetical protein n=1 Tax=Bifidobacterium sp. ESL0763 TaxID=2983227 RepID=UPI0023F7EF76|nr:hypothetical protein [Bifidobacterium sp. ESL0763]MDF7664259.1 hypothetical protein [Bifidobacterium sp. ESL0763]
MRLIPVKQALSMMENATPAKSQYRRITFLTAKKDRSLCLEHDEHGLVLHEQGYRDESTAFTSDKHDAHECKHAIKQAFKREFPRSHKVYCATVK